MGGINYWETVLQFSLNSICSSDFNATYHTSFSAFMFNISFSLSVYLQITEGPKQTAHHNCTLLSIIAWQSKSRTKVLLNFFFATRTKTKHQLEL